MTGIFINYRSDDSGYAAALVYERLQAEFGADNVFRDCRSIEVGTDFSVKLWERLRRSEVLLVLIGPDWLTLRNADGIRRIDDPEDFVRRAIMEAFRCSLSVVPVLLDGAHRPSAAELPRELEAFSRRQYVTLCKRYDRADLDDLIGQLRQHPELAKLTTFASPDRLPGPAPATVFQHGGIQFLGPTHVNGDVVGGNKTAGGGDR